MTHERPGNRLPSLARAAAAVALGASLVFAPGTGTAWAEPPLSLSQQVTDNSAALRGSEAEVTERLSQLQSESGVQLHVVFVDAFDDMDPGTWAQQTYERSRLGGNDVLLAVATGDRYYATWAGGAGITPEQDAQIRSRLIEPRLAQGDWAGAVLAAADGYARAAGSGADAGGANSDIVGAENTGIGIGWLLPVAALVVLGVAIFAVRRRSKRNQNPQNTETPAATGESEDLTAAPATPEELSKGAAAALVSLDDGLRSSEEELAFAEAQFGTQATTRFREALKEAKTRSVEAFRVQQEVDDGSIPPERHTTAWARIIALADEARDILDEHTEEFERMRNLQADVPRMLGELQTRVGEVRHRMPSAQQQLAVLQATYPAETLATVQANVTEAGTLLDAADKLITDGRGHLGRDDRSAAVVSARGAEDALGHANSLLDGVDRAHVELQNASAELDRRLASISSDVADAERLRADDPLTAGALTAARGAITQGKKARSGGDPLAALDALDTAERDLDNALQGYREADATRSKAASRFTDQYQRVRARLDAIDESIRTHRGAVGTDARTRISEALRLAEEAQSLAATDPEAATDLMAQAQRYGEEALRYAQDDQNRFDGGGFGGGFGGGRRAGVDPTSLILGGILMGGGRPRSGGGWGGGGFGGGGGGFGGGGSFGGGGGGFGGGGSFGGGGGGFGGGGRF